MYWQQPIISSITAPYQEGEIILKTTSWPKLRPSCENTHLCQHPAVHKYAVVYYVYVHVIIIIIITS